MWERRWAEQDGKGMTLHHQYLKPPITNSSTNTQKDRQRPLSAFLGPYAYVLAKLLGQIHINPSGQKFTLTEILISIDLGVTAELYSTTSDNMETKF